jgi:hypothetical protein
VLACLRERVIRSSSCGFVSLKNKSLQLYSRPRQSEATKNACIYTVSFDTTTHTLENDVRITRARPYGDLAIERKQCINHFSKSMKTRLTTRSLCCQATHRAEHDTFSDDSKIYRLPIYFGKAIRDNNDDLEKMKQAAWAA